LNTYGAHFFLNQNMHAMLRGYEEGDPLKLSTLVIFPVGETPMKAAEQIFRLTNADNRPNAHIERSMSVGDVVRIMGGNERGEIQEWWFACADIGFTEISKPVLDT